MSSTIWLYIALAIFIIALIIAGIGVGMFVSGIKEPLKKIKGSADNLKERMNLLTLETTSLQHHANELKEDMQAKSQKFSTLIDAARGTKNSVLDLNSSVKTITTGVAEKVSRDKGNIAQVNQWSHATSDLLDLRDFWKNRKTESATYSSAPLLDHKQAIDQ
jgi:uncharacterized protein YoxC